MIVLKKKSHGNSKQKKQQQLQHWYIIYRYRRNIYSKEPWDIGAILDPQLEIFHTNPRFIIWIQKEF